MNHFRVFEIDLVEHMLKKMDSNGTKRSENASLLEIKEMWKVLEYTISVKKLSRVWKRNWIIIENNFKTCSNWNESEGGIRNVEGLDDC